MWKRVYKSKIFGVDNALLIQEWVGRENRSECGSSYRLSDDRARGRECRIWKREREILEARHGEESDTKGEKKEIKIEFWNVAGFDNKNTVLRIYKGI